MTNREYMLIKMGVDVTSISAALDRLSGMMASWAGGIANNLASRLRAYIERLVGVALAIKGLDLLRKSIEDLNQAISDAGSLAEKLRTSLAVAVEFKLLSKGIGEATDALVRWYEELQKGGRPVADFVTTMREQFEKLTTTQVQLQLLQKGGRLLSGVEIEQLRDLLDKLAAAGKEGPRPSGLAIFGKGMWLSTKAMAGIAPESLGDIATWMAMDRWEAEVRKSIATLRPSQIFAALASLPAQFGRTMRELTATPAVPEFIRSKQREAENLARQQAIERELKVIEIFEERFRNEEDYNRQLAALADRHKKTLELLKVVPEEKRFEVQMSLLKIENEELNVRREMARKRAEMQEKMRREEEKYNEAVADFSRRMADLQDRLEGIEESRLALRRRFFPDIQQIAQDPFSPFRRIAMAQQFFEASARMLRARGRVQMAEIAEQRVLQLEEMLKRMGVTFPENPLQKLNRSAERIQRAIDALVHDANRKGIKIQPQLTE